MNRLKNTKRLILETYEYNFTWIQEITLINNKILKGKSPDRHSSEEYNVKSP